MTIRASVMFQALLVAGLSAGAFNSAKAADPCPYCTAKYHACLNAGNTEAVCNARGAECMDQYCDLGFTPAAKVVNKAKRLFSPGYTDKSLIAAIDDPSTITASP